MRGCPPGLVASRLSPMFGCLPGLVASRFSPMFGCPPGLAERSLVFFLSRTRGFDDAVSMFVRLLRVTVPYTLNPD